MKKLLLVAMLLFSSVAFGQQIIPQEATNNWGQTFVRLYNNTPYYRTCLIQDQINYFTFTIAPNSYSLWYPVYGQGVWRCN